MASTITNAPLGEQIMRLLNNGCNKEQIEVQLIEQGHEVQFVKAMIQETIKLRNAKARAQGLSFILVGAVLCFASFLLTITSSFSHSGFGIVLYGLTTIGIVIAFIGFTKIF